MTSNAHEKLDAETENQFRKSIHTHFLKCNVKRMTADNEDVTYPTIGSLHKSVMDTERFPKWSYTTFRDVLLGMNIKMMKKSEVDRAILIVDDHHWPDL